MKHPIQDIDNTFPVCFVNSAQRSWFP